MRISLQTSAEGMKDADETGSKSFRFIEFTEHTKEDITDSMKEAVKERAVSPKVVAKLFRNGKYAVSVRAVNKFKGDSVSAANRVEVAAGGTEAAFAGEGDGEEFTAVRALINSEAVREITAMDHFVDIIKNSGTNRYTAESDSIKMIVKNLFQNIHETIISQRDKKEHPTNCTPQE